MRLTLQYGLHRFAENSYPVVLSRDFPGTKHERDTVERHLQPGTRYHVAELTVHDTASWLTLHEVPGVSFNTMFFDPVPRDIVVSISANAVLEDRYGAITLEESYRRGDDPAQVANLLEKQWAHPGSPPFDLEDQVCEIFRRLKEKKGRQA